MRGRMNLNMKLIPAAGGRAGQKLSSQGCWRKLLDEVNQRSRICVNVCAVFVLNKIMNGAIRQMLRFSQQTRGIFKSLQRSIKSES